MASIQWVHLAVIVFVLCLDLHVNYLRIFQYVSPRYRWWKDSAWRRGQCVGFLLRLCHVLQVGVLASYNMPPFMCTHVQSMCIMYKCHMLFYAYTQWDNSRQSEPTLFSDNGHARWVFITHCLRVMCLAVFTLLWITCSKFTVMSFGLCAGSAIATMLLGVPYYAGIHLYAYFILVQIFGGVMQVFW